VLNIISLAIYILRRAAAALVEGRGGRTWSDVALYSWRAVTYIYLAPYYAGHALRQRAKRYRANAYLKLSNVYLYYLFALKSLALNARGGRPTHGAANVLPHLAH